MEIILYVIILALAVNLMANMIWKYLPYTDKRADVWVTVIIIIVCVLIIISRKEDTKVSTGQQPPPPQECPYELRKYNEMPWAELISGANYRVSAVGISLTLIDEPRLEQLIEKIKKNKEFKVKLFMLRPHGKAIEERTRDEEPPPIPNVIEGKLSTFRKLIKQLGPDDEKRLTVKCYDEYPTIAVVIIDADLYTYSYIYGERAIRSTVTIFKNYERNPRTSDLAGYFIRHLESIEHKADKTKDACS
jgi:hypothetical protein